MGLQIGLIVGERGKIQQLKPSLDALIDLSSHLAITGPAEPQPRQAPLKELNAFWVPHRSACDRCAPTSLYWLFGYFAPSGRLFSISAASSPRSRSRFSLVTVMSLQSGRSFTWLMNPSPFRAIVAISIFGEFSSAVTSSINRREKHSIFPISSIITRRD